MLIISNPILVEGCVYATGLGRSGQLGIGPKQLIDFIP